MEKTKYTKPRISPVAIKTEFFTSSTSNPHKVSGLDSKSEVDKEGGKESDSRKNETGGFWDWE